MTSNVLNLLSLVLWLIWAILANITSVLEKNMYHAIVWPSGPSLNIS